MTRILLASTLFVLAGHAVAQPQLLSSEMAPFGTRVEYRYIDSLEIIDTTIQGADVTWSFDSLYLAASPDSLVLTVVNPTQTPYGSQFPGANYAHHEQPVTAYRYFNLSDSTMERVGEWQGSLNYYSDPRTEYVFPLELGVSNHDTWDNSVTTFAGTYSLTCVGYGTLILPTGTHLGTLMVRARLSESSIVLLYFWYDSDNGLPLLAYSPGDGFIYPEFGFYMLSLSVVGSQPTVSLDQFTYNNPARDLLKVNIASERLSILSYAVRDLAGRLVFSGTRSLDVGPNELLIDVSRLASGVYLTTLMRDDQKHTFKVVKN